MPLRLCRQWERTLLTAPFFIVAQKGRVIAAIQAELERAFQHQAARERLQISKRQAVMRCATQSIQRIHDCQNVAQGQSAHRSRQRVSHSVQAVDRSRNDAVQLAARRSEDFLDGGKLFEFVSDGQEFVRRGIAENAAEQNGAFALARDALPDMRNPLPRTRAGQQGVIGALHLRRAVEQVRANLDEGHHFGGDAVLHRPRQPVLRSRFYNEMYQRSLSAVPKSHEIAPSSGRLPAAMIRHSSPSAQCAMRRSRINP